VGKPPHQERTKIPMSRMIMLCRSREGGMKHGTTSASTDSVEHSAWVRLDNKDVLDRRAE
jgi:hypothetical protein